LAADVPQLNSLKDFLQDHLPWLKHRKKTLDRIREEFCTPELDPDKNVNYRSMFDLEDKEALAILELFPDRRTRYAPLVSVVRSNEERSCNTWPPDPLVKITLSKDPNEAGLARPLPLSKLERLAEDRLHDLIYSCGFVGMLVGAIFQIVAVFLS